MDKNLQNIEDLFKKGLKGIEELPSEKVWNDLEQSLKKDNSVKLKKKYNSLKKATAFLVVVVALLGIYVLKNESNKISSRKNGNVAEIAGNQKPPSVTKPNHPSGTIDNEQPENNLNRTRKGDPNKVITSGAGENALKRNRGNKNINPPTIKVSNITTIDHENLWAELKNNSENDYSAFPKKPGVKDDAEDHFDNLHLFPALKIELPITTFNLKEVSTVSPYIMPAKLTIQRPVPIARSPRFYAGFFYSPTIPFSRLRDDDHHYGNPDSREFERRESGSYSYSFGFSIGYGLNRKWSLQTGMIFSTLRMHVEPEKIYAERDNGGMVKYPITTSSGKGYILPSFRNNPSIGDSLFSRNTKHTLQYTAIPVAIQYSLSSRRRLSTNLLAGLSANLLSRGKISTEVKSGNESELEETHEIHGLKSLYFNGLTGISFNYKLYNNLALTFSPIVNFAIDPINKNLPVKSYPGTIDFQFGLQTKF
ncbi:MAG: outer membrane beta-barrel protein [Ginsengibacter sp.]